MESNYIALIPAYKPGDNFIPLLAQLQTLGFSIVTVDDGSGDDFSSLFEEAKLYATVLTHEINQGKGCALKTGYTYIQKHFLGENLLVTVDADGQHRVDDALAICQIAKNHPDTLVLGSRKLTGKIPLRSRFGNGLTRLIYRLSTGLTVRDTQTGLRAFSTQFLSKMTDIPGERYEYEMNVLLTFAKEHIPIVEHEIETIYLNNNESSHFHVLKDSYRVYKEILKFSASSLIGFLVDYCLYGILLFVTTILSPSLGMTYLHCVRLSNIGARIVSASVNYTINRKFVFQSKQSVASSALKYFLLALVILVGNTLVLSFLVDRFAVPSMIAKMITELLFFFLSWTVQRCIIFRSKDMAK